MTSLRPGWSAALDDYATFHREATTSHDHDPVYPVLAELAHREGWDGEKTLWACLVFVAYYDLGSALRVLTEYPAPAVPREELLKLPCATERRAHRDPRQLRRHLGAIVEAANTWGGLKGWFVAGTAGLPVEHMYRAMNPWMQHLYGNGRWAAYKTCELLGHVLARVTNSEDLVHLSPTDMGHAHSSGPRHGLALVWPDAPTGNSRAEVEVLDEASWALCRELTGRGLWAPVCVAETTLCDFHALVDGRYYVGHDIDQMQTQLNRTWSELTASALQARARSLPRTYLGELNGWNGVDKDRRQLYRQTGRIVIRTPDGDATALLAIRQETAR